MKSAAAPTAATPARGGGLVVVVVVVVSATAEISLYCQENSSFLSRSDSTDALPPKSIVPIM